MGDATSGAPVRYRVSPGGVGQVLLDRPKALNSLTQDVVEDLIAHLTVWRALPSVRVVTLAGAGERAFCAGGDVVAARAAILAGDFEAAARFWEREYDLIELVATYPKPVVALQHGYVMGGGLGLSAHAAHRWATPDTRFAMPETGIGFFPDAGISHLLARAPGETGTYLALTGATIDATSGRYADLTDHLLAPAALAAALAALEGGCDPAEALVVARTQIGRPGPVPDDASLRPDDEGSSRLEADRTWIDPCFAPTAAAAAPAATADAPATAGAAPAATAPAASSAAAPAADEEAAVGPGEEAVGILHRLETHPDPRARECATLLRGRSPLSVAVALARVRAARAEPDVVAALATDRRIARAMMRDGDFVEGVRARLVDKDEARWRHTNQKAVTPAEVTAFLA